MKTLLASILFLLAQFAEAGHSFTKQVDLDKLQKELKDANFAVSHIRCGNTSCVIEWSGAEAKDPQSIIDAHSYVAPRTATKFSTTTYVNFEGTSAASCDEKTIPLTGCIKSDVVRLGGTNNLDDGTCIAKGHVSSTDNVTIKRCNFGVIACSNPGVEAVKVVCSED